MAAGSNLTTMAGLSRSLLRSPDSCSSFGRLGCLLDVGHLGVALDKGLVPGVTSRTEPEPVAEALGKEVGPVAVGSVSWMTSGPSSSHIECLAAGPEQEEQIAAAFALSLT